MPRGPRRRRASRPGPLGLCPITAPPAPAWPRNASAISAASRRPLRTKCERRPQASTRCRIARRAVALAGSPTAASSSITFPPMGRQPRASVVARFLIRGAWHSFCSHAGKRERARRHLRQPQVVRSSHVVTGADRCCSRRLSERRVTPWRIPKAGSPAPRELLSRDLGTPMKRRQLREAGTCGGSASGHATPRLPHHGLHRQRAWQL